MYWFRSICATTAVVFGFSRAARMTTPIAPGAKYRRRSFDADIKGTSRRLSPSPAGAYKQSSARGTSEPRPDLEPEGKVDYW
jgi:hypothetical protein